MNFRHGIRRWLFEERPLTAGPRFLLSQLKLAYQIVRQLIRERWLQRAAALSFFTLLCLLPIGALLVYLLTRFFLDVETIDRVKQFVITHFIRIVDPAAVDRLVDQLVANLAHLGGGRTSLAAVGLLLIAAIGLYNTVERYFNEIWQVQRRRNLFHRLAHGWVVVTLTPLLLVGSITVTRFLQEAVFRHPLMDRFWSVAIPLVIAGSGFLFAYKVIPNTRVRWRPAAIGAGAATVLWQVATSGLQWYVDHLARIAPVARVYGSFALVPIFLIWVYYTWLVILFGVALAYTLQHLESLEAAEREALWREEAGALGPVLDLTGALAALCGIARRHAAGTGGATVEELSRELRCLPDGLAGLLEACVREGVLCETTENPPRYLPARPLDQIPAAALLAAYHSRKSYAAMPSRTEPGLALERMGALLGSSLRGKSLADLLAESAAAPARER